MVERNDEFYIGYLEKSPPGIAARSRAGVLAAIVVGLLLAVVLVFAQSRFGTVPQSILNGRLLERRARHEEREMLERDGVRIHYEEHGEGPAILLSHGFCATLRMWQGQVAAFGGDYRIITWDMRGHGQTDSPTELALYSPVYDIVSMSLPVEFTLTTY